MDHNHDNRFCVIIGKYVHIYNITLGMHETNKICLNVGASAILDTTELCVITFPKHTVGAPHVLLTLFLGAVDSGGPDNMGELLTCWLKCSVEASVNTLSDA